MATSDTPGHATEHGPHADIALITGAGRRIGRAIATELAAKGWQIAVHYRQSRDDAEQLVADIIANGGKAAALPADLARQDDVAGLLAACAKRLGPATCLINNASEFQGDTARTTQPELWDLHHDVNLKAPVFLAQAFAEHLPAHALGNIINIIDQRVWNLKPEFFSYTISKAGLWTATRLLAQELAPRIRVNAIGPGPVLQSIHQTDQDFRDEIDATLLKRGPSPKEIAAAVCFILTAPAMTGQMIALDSGQHLT